MKTLATLLLACTGLASLTAAPRAQRADVIVVLDSSASMQDEASQVQALLNTFASVVQASGVSLRLILIAEDDSSASGVCLPPPLGSGACPVDDNPPVYRHVVTGIGPGDVFNTILGSHASWSGFLRPFARRTLIVITDDDDDLSAADFESQLLALDPSFEGLRFHAIVAAPFVMTDPCAVLAANPGREYIELASRTGGRFYDLCAQDLSPFFLDAAVQVVAQSRRGGRLRSADRDGDGFTFGQGDCQELPMPGSPFPELVNAGAYELPGNLIDDDCNGIVDDAPLTSCSTATNLDASALELAQALDLCTTTTDAGGPWGLISAELSLADGTSAPNPLQVSAKTEFGGYLPQVGSTLVVLSTGVARAESDPGFVSPGSCTESLGGTDHATAVLAPAAWLAANGGAPYAAAGCPVPSTTVHDSVLLRLRMRVPTNATALRFRHAFFNTDWPDVCSSFNDTALALITEGRAAGIPADGNVMLDRLGNPLTMQTATFETCLGCPLGTGPLSGTGFDPVSDAATAWTEAVVPVVPGAEMTLEFHLWDGGDGNCDSTLLLDGLRFDLP